jgi:tetratricopeptide (TPR) repeat protein
MNSPRADELFRRALMLHQSGDLAQAASLYQAVLAEDPGHADALSNLGAALNKAGRHNEAVAHFERALAIAPENTPALNNLGNALLALGRADEAAGRLLRAVELNPDFVEARINLGYTLRALGRAADAETHYRFLLARNPQSKLAMNALGLALREQGRVGEAIEVLRETVRLHPGYADPLANIAELEAAHGSLEVAIRLHGEALASSGESKSIRGNRAYTMFAAGRMAEAWEDYEFRWDVRERGQARSRRNFAQPVWTGGALDGKRLLIWGEQGVGDELWTAGMVAEAHERIGRSSSVVVECVPKLVSLFRASFADIEFVARTDPPDPACIAGVEFQIAAGSLGRILRPNLESFPKREQSGGAYLSADPMRIAYWRGKLAGLGRGMKVGVCWRSINTLGERALSCSKLVQWMEVLRVPGVHFVNMQYDDCEAELRETEQIAGVKIHRYPEVDLFDDLAETAALMRGLDLVISAPTAVSILSAALGVPTWQLNYGREWQRHGKADNPWYPSMRNHVRRWDESWEAALARIASELKLMAD